MQRSRYQLTSFICSYEAWSTRSSHHILSSGAVKKKYGSNNGLHWSHYDLMTPCGDTKFGSTLIHRMTCCLTRHQAILWTNSGLSSAFSRGTVRCRYNAVNFLTNIHKRHPIARPLGRGMGCLLWIQRLIDTLSQFLQLFMQYLTILDRAITALHCINLMALSSEDLKIPFIKTNRKIAFLKSRADLLGAIILTWKSKPYFVWRRKL